MVGHSPLKAGILVRVQAPELLIIEQLNNPVELFVVFTTVIKNILCKKNAPQSEDCGALRKKGRLDYGGAVGDFE